MIGPQVERNVTLKAAANRKLSIYHKPRPYSISVLGMNSQRGSESSTITRPGGVHQSPNSFFASRNASAANTLGHMASKPFTARELSADGRVGSQAQFIPMGPQTNFMLKKQNEESKLLKQVISRLCEKLKDYQKQFSSNKSMLAAEQEQVD